METKFSIQILEVQPERAVFLLPACQTKYLAGAIPGLVIAHGIVILFAIFAPMPVFPAAKQNPFAWMLFGGWPGNIWLLFMIALWGIFWAATWYYIRLRFTETRITVDRSQITVDRRLWWRRTTDTIPVETQTCAWLHRGYRGRYSVVIGERCKRCDRIGIALSDDDKAYLVDTINRTLGVDTSRWPDLVIHDEALEFRPDCLDPAMVESDATIRVNSSDPNRLEIAVATSVQSRRDRWIYGFWMVVGCIVTVAFFVNLVARFVPGRQESLGNTVLATLVPFLLGLIAAVAAWAALLGEVFIEFDRQGLVIHWKIGPVHLRSRMAIESIQSIVVRTWKDPRSWPWSDAEAIAGDVFPNCVIYDGKKRCDVTLFQSGKQAILVGGLLRWQLRDLLQLKENHELVG